MRRRPEWKKWAAVLAALAGLFLVYRLVGGCPVRWLTGLACPGCGMTRAATALCRLDFAGAWHMHPLVFAMPVFAVLFFVFRNRKKGAAAVTAVFFVSLAALWLWRLLAGVSPDVVYFRPETGAVYHLIQWIKEWKLWR